MPALWRLSADTEAEVRRIVAERLPAPLLSVFADDADLLVRWHAAGRADIDLLRRLAHDTEADIRERAEQRLAELAAGQTVTRPLPLDESTVSALDAPMPAAGPLAGQSPAALHPV
jgi:hypothetical protein